MWTVFKDSAIYMIMFEPWITTVDKFSLAQRHIVEISGKICSYLFMKPNKGIYLRKDLNTITGATLKGWNWISATVYNTCTSSVSPCISDVSLENGLGKISDWSENFFFAGPLSCKWTILVLLLLIKFCSYSINDFWKTKLCISRNISLH